MRKVERVRPVTPRVKPKKKVAAYARVSMETERLMHSLSAQVSHYSKYIQKNPEWEYAGVYSDERNAMLIRYIWLRIVIVTNMQ